MGTTSQKLTYLNDTKQELKQKINNLGGDITDQTTFRQYAEQLQNVYDILPKTDYAEGSNITLSNTLKGKLDFEDGIVGYGDTKQDTTQGINMLDLSNFSAETTINGVKFTPVENGGIKINGTATANAILEFAFSLVLNGNYTMATKLDGTFTNNESPQVILRSSNATVIYNSGMQQNAIKINTFNNINSTIDKVRIVAVNGSTYNCIIYPMCLSGIYNTADSLPDFEKFTGNSPSPNPSYPQDIEVVRGNIEVVERGINYCNLSNSNPESTTNINISINDNSSLLFDSNGETVQDSKNIFDSFTLPKVATLPKGDYTFAIEFIGDCNVSVNTIASYLKASASVGSGTYAICTNVGTITNGTRYSTRFTMTEEKDVYLQVFTNSQSKKFTNTQMRFMIYSGSYATTTDIPTYEPYIIPITYQLSLGEYEFAKIGNYVDTIEYDVENDKVYKNKAVEKIASYNGQTITTDYISTTGQLTTGATVYYGISTTQEEITGTLKDQIKALYNSQSFTGTTIIEIDGQLPLIIKVRALKGE